MWAGFAVNSPKRYLISAMINWIVDNGCTPYIVIDCAVAGVAVPESFIVEGHVVLNVSANAVRNFQLKDDIAFNTRFHGSNYRVSAPIAAIVMVFSKENGQGMAFNGGTPVLIASDT